MDPTKAYLQLHIDLTLHKYQAVNIDGELYIMTQMGFVLNVTSKIMAKIMSKVLSLEQVKEQITT